MPWKETNAMNERIKLIEDYQRNEWSITELSKQFGISRNTVYKWIMRFKQNGMQGLNEYPRLSRIHPNQTSGEVEEKILRFRQKHAHWGPKKILYRLKLIESLTKWPARSTVGEILKRHGLVKTRRYRRGTPSYREQLQQAKRANDIWTADFKGWFRMKDGKRIDPLTIADCDEYYFYSHVCFSFYGCWVLIKVAHTCTELKIYLIWTQ